jgi:hypothetical protein
MDMPAQTYPHPAELCYSEEIILYVRVESSRSEAQHDADLGVVMGQARSKNEEHGTAHGVTHVVQRTFPSNGKHVVNHGG